MTYFNEFGQARLGWRTPVSGGGGGGIDSDAQAFITAASITDSTQQSAINTLVTQLKTYGIWTKLKAVYPFVGGTASSHKFNLKDPRDLDVAFRLVFNGGWTHSSNGALPNGSNAYADSKFIPLNNATDYNAHLSYYSRTNNTTSGVDIGAFSPGSNYFLQLWTTLNGGISRSSIQRSDTDFSSFVSTTRQGHFIGQVGLSGSNSFSKIYQDGVLKNTNNVNNTIARSNRAIYIGALNADGSAGAYINRESAFASIGDGLTDTEAANFYTAVQTFQTTLNRQVGVPIVADSDAQAFLNAAVITDSTQASAINTLVTSLKSANIWTKMKAIYPFVGGTASSHKFNLKDPRDVDAAYRLVFNGGWTHSSTGALPNGSNAYADTKLGANILTATNHLSYYSRNITVNTEVELGVYDNLPSSEVLQLRAANNYVSGQAGTGGSSINFTTTTNAKGFWIGTKRATNDREVFLNGISQGTNTGSENSTLPSINVYLGARNSGGTSAQLYSTKECSFATIGSDGLTPANALALYNAIQVYQTTLGRQV